MESLKKEFYKHCYWEDTYDKMVLKQGFSKEDTDLLWKLKEIEKDDIIEELFSGDYVWSIPRRTEIAKSESKKKRIVYIYGLKDRYVLGVIYRAVSAFYRDKISDSCFSYKKGESTSHAIEYIKKNKSDKMQHGVKVDIHAYFNSVNEEKVVQMINELFYGGFKKTVENIMLDKRVYWKGKIVQEWKSLIPGCAFGSFFANYTLKECDEYFKDKVYARYSDDIIILEETKEEVEKDIEKILEFLKKYGLTMNPDKYTWFKPGDSVEYLGLKLRGDGKIDISDHAKKKIKKQIHRWCRKARMRMEIDLVPFEKEATKVIRQFNNKNFKCAVRHDTEFGWCAYAFPRINTIDSLVEIDKYFKDTIRAMKTGHHNKANFRAMTDDEFKKLGWVSLVDLYLLYKHDYDYYCEIIELL